MADLSRRSFLLAAGAGVVGTAVAWPRLTAADIPGRGEDALRVAIIGTAQDAEGRNTIVEEFNKLHPDIPVQVQGIQGADWSQFFAKVLTLAAAGTLTLASSGDAGPVIWTYDVTGPGAPPADGA